MTLPVKLRLDVATWLGDLLRGTGEFETDAGFETAITISLFTDRRARDDDILPSSDDERQGWWADTYADTTGDQIGSRLWLLRRSKTSQDVLNASVTYAREALQWLLDDGVASDLQITAERVSNSILGLRIVITRSNDPASRYDKLWEVMLNEL